MSLELRRALYFKFCVGARFRLTPVPTTSKEVAFLHESFAKLACLEHFQVEKPKHSASHLFGRHVTVLFNASDQMSQLDPLAGFDPKINTTVAALRQRQRELNAYLKSICGLPRYSYIEGDELYFQGRLQVPFKHSLTTQGKRYSDQYTMTGSTVSRPFATIDTAHDPGEVLAALRHNFQKYHKMEPVFVENGMRAVLRITGEKYGTTFSVDTNDVGDVDVTDLQKDIPIKNVHENKSCFNGFLDN